MKSFCILEQGGGVGAEITARKKRLFTTEFSDFYRLNWKTNDDPDAYVTQTGIVWSEGRSLLYDRIPKQYEYYIFIDDDVEFYTLDECPQESIPIRIRDLLTTWNPLSATFYDPDSWVFRGVIPFRNSINKEVFPVAAFDCQSFIMHRSLCEVTMPIWIHGSDATKRYINYIVSLIAPNKQLCFTTVLAANTEHLLHESTARPQHNPSELLLYRQNACFKAKGLMRFNRGMRKYNIKAWHQIPDATPTVISESQIMQLLENKDSYISRSVTSSTDPVGRMTKLGMIIRGSTDRPLMQSLKLVAKWLIRSGRID